MDRGPPCWYSVEVPPKAFDKVLLACPISALLHVAPGAVTPQVGAVNAHNFRMKSKVKGLKLPIELQTPF
jgi:hypothetical protein